MEWSPGADDGRPISIHAPTRGATNEKLHKTKLVSISIHAPTRGATCTAWTNYKNKSISIHAPTRGATAKMHNIPYASLQ